MSTPLSTLPQAIYSTDQVRGFDRHAIDELGIEGFELMQRAGRAALDYLRARWPEAKSLTIFCGAGNNAGDGYVVAALGHAAELAVQVLAVVDPGELTGDAASAVAMAKKAGVAIDAFAADADATGDVLVDGLLGTGLTRDVGGEFAEAVKLLNRSAAPVLALDVPTGLDSDSGAVRGNAVQADATISFVGLKTGLFLGAGPGHRGDLGFSDLGLPAEVYADATPQLRRLRASDLAQTLKRRSRIAHKGLNGRVLVVGGSVGMSGAARLAAEAALRSGAGLVHAAVAPDSVAAVMAGRPEIMCRGVTQPAELADWAAAADVIVVGPGLGRSDWGQQLAAAMLASDKPLVVDADALNYLAEHAARSDNWVLTPHPGEAARLLGRTAAEIQLSRQDAITSLVRQFGGFAVLKGACSLIGGADTAPGAVCDYGNPGMATGGTGDVLAGVLGGLIAQFGLALPVVEAAVLVHALAGDDAAFEGERGLVASDLLRHIRHRVNPV